MDAYQSADDLLSANADEEDILMADLSLPEPMEQPQVRPAMLHPEQPQLQPLPPVRWLFLEDDVNAFLQQHTNLAATNPGVFQALLGDIAALYQRLDGVADNLSLTQIGELLPKRRRLADRLTQLRNVILAEMAATTTDNPAAAKPVPAAAVKLPKLEVKRFSGKTAEWIEFKAQYLSSICLLYTSPSPRDRTRSRMPSSA